MDFYLVFCKSSKKFDKYVKLNRIRSKCVIDIKKMMEEENVSNDTPATLEYFKVLVFKKMQLAAKKRKDIYYIPNFDNAVPVEKLLRIRELLVHHKFNMLFFYEEFRDDEIKESVMDLINDFDASQIIKDY